MGSEPLNADSLAQYFAGIERLRAAALAGENSSEPHEHLLLELIRARAKWSERPGETVLHYLKVFVAFVEWLEPHCQLDLELPLKVAIGSLEEQEKAAPGSWLKSDRGSARSTVVTRLRRAIIAAAVDCYVAKNFTVSLACSELAQELRTPVRQSRNGDQISAEKIKHWHRRFTRKGGKNAASSDELRMFAECKKALSTYPPSAIPAVVKDLITGRLDGAAFRKGE